MGADCGDVEFGTFLMVVLVWGVDADGLDRGVCDGACFVHGAVDIFYG